MLPLNFLEKKISFEGARPLKGLKIRPFSKMSKPKSSFLNISKNSFINELQSLFLSYLNTQHSICEIFNFLLFACRGGPKMISKKLFQLGFVKRFFLLKQKIEKIFLYWVSKKCCQRV